MRCYHLFITTLVDREKFSDFNVGPKHFWNFPFECKCCTMVQWSQFITFASSRVHWRGSLWINVFKRFSSNPENLPERGVSLMSKRSSLKRENYFLTLLSPLSLSSYTAQIFLIAFAAFTTHSRRRKYRRCSNFSTWRPQLHSLSSNDRTSICRLKHNDWTSNKKWQSINKPIATGLSTRETISLQNYAPTWYYATILKLFQN